MTCAHVPIVKQGYPGWTRVLCLRCHHSWLECPIVMSHDEYDSALLMLAAYLLGRGQPDDHTQA